MTIQEQRSLRPPRKSIASVISQFTSDQMTIDERLAKGKALRSKVERESHGQTRAGGYRRDPVAIIEAQAANRVPELLAVRHARMLASPFAYFRGAAAVMAADLFRTPDAGVTVQACGDMHVMNFGLFASAERELVFAINDFDETYPAAWEWDLKRLAASAAVAARFLGGNKSDEEEAARAVVARYRKQMRTYAQLGFLEIWYSTIDAKSLLGVLSSDVRARALAVIKKAKTRGHLQTLEKMTEIVDDRRRIIEDPPFIVRSKQTHGGRPIGEALGMFLEAYLQSLQGDRRFLLSRYRVVDVARKVVGIGSVGTRCWVVMLEGASSKDPLFLQVKEAQPSVLAPYFKADLPASEGHRVVTGQRLIQGSPDIFLGWGELDRTHFYVRQLRDMKGGAEFTPGESKISTFVEYCGLCGWALALAHAKSGDAAIISGYVGKSDVLDSALAKFALRYADQTDRDYDAMVKSARSGRIAVADFGN